MRRKKEPKYYRIRASVFWSVVIVVIIVCIYLGGEWNYVNNTSETVETDWVEYGTIVSQLKNIEECYLCGN